MRMRTTLALMLLCTVPHGAFASGHGPVFGAATPTLGKGGWQLDQAWLVRLGEGPNTEDQTLRTMISFGITEDLQVSGSLPINLVTSGFMPRGRLTTMMSPARAFEVTTAWRFHRRASGSSRFESTAFVGGAVPLEKISAGGMYAAPSLNVSVASGYASRTHYFWVGGGYQRHAGRQGDRMGDIGFYSVVYGYRPPALRVDYPKPDLRFFVEAVGERTANGRHHGFDLTAGGGHALLAGPTALLLYKAYGLEAGILFPVYERTNFSPGERFRAAVNFSYFFWLQ